VAYTDAQAVADYLGRDLTGLQFVQVDRLLPAADAWIAGYCGRAFGLSAAVTGERHTLYGPLLFLRNRPVASVQAVRSRPWGVAAVSTALVAAQTYELTDPGAGLLQVSSGYVGDVVEVDYTPGQTVPGDVAHAATLLVASWLQPTIEAEGVAGGASAQAVKSYTIGQELTVAYDTASAAAAGAQTAGVPDDVLTLLAPYRRLLVFA
jgi:hypothetical protein